ncbi:umecyanin-like [Alnus glutinosa]|uniref:umecyanin-like n=1 Tax=Alnus glutinosa TaxID=3517 RepID=UPI002D78691C|nr:umecyanin-like [Alnus glutinosa]
MASTMNVTLLVVALIAAATVLPGTQAAEYVVGDATGWTIPSSANFYSDWATGKNFSAGDILVFNFAPNVHDVATVNETAFGACEKSNPLSITSTGPANITLTSGNHYFICTIGQHCAGGQKLAVINVTAASSGTPTPPGVPSPPPPPPSAPSSASSLAATFSFILMTIASTIFCLF